MKTEGVIFMAKVNIILGPPGTGKTENLLRIVDRELKEKTADSHEIGFFTFTKIAAKEAINRAIEKCNLTDKDFPYFSTLHAFGKRQLLMNNAEVMRESDYRKFSNFTGIRLNFISQDWDDTGIVTTDNEYLKEINKCKNKCMGHSGLS